MASQFFTISSDIRAWRSRVTMIGVFGPTSFLTSLRRVPSASGMSSATIAPWRARRTPFTFSASRRPRVIVSTNTQ